MFRTVKNSLIAAAMTVTLHSAFAGVIFSDNFTSGTVGTQPDGWWAISGALAGVSPLLVTDNTTPLSGKAAAFTGASGNSNFIAPIPSTTLAVGDSITFTLNMRFTATPGTTGPLIGLYNSNGTTIGANYFGVTSPTANDMGYQTWKVMNTGTNDIKVGGSTNGNFFQYITVGNTQSTGLTTDNLTPHTIGLTLTRTASGLEITSQFDTFTSAAYSIENASVLTYTFDEAIITGNSASIGKAANYDNIVISTIPEPATWALLISGLTTVMVLRRRRA